MYAGRIVESGFRPQVLHHPAHPYTALLLASVPRLSQRQQLSGIAGTAPAPRLRPAGCFFAPRCPMVTDECRAAFPPVTRLSADQSVRCWHAAKRLTVSRFAQLPHFQLSPRGLHDDFVDAALKKHGLSRTVVARVPHFTTAPQLVLAARGIAVVPERLARTWAAQGLRVVEAPVPLPGFSMATYFPETSRHDAAHSWFRRLLVECVDAR